MIIVLYPYTFSNYFLNKFKFLEIQKKLKVPIKYIDLSKILYPNKNKIFSQSKNKKVLEFQTINQWKKYMSEKAKGKKIYILNLLSQDSYASFKIHYYLKNLNSNICGKIDAHVRWYVCSKSDKINDRQIWKSETRRIENTAKHRKKKEKSRYK